MTAASQSVEQENFMPAQAERKYGLSQWIWRRLAYSGRIASIKVGPRLLIPRSECERILSENTRPRKAGCVPTAGEAPADTRNPRPDVAQASDEDTALPHPANRLNRSMGARMKRPWGGSARPAGMA